MSKQNQAIEKAFNKAVKSFGNKDTFSKRVKELGELIFKKEDGFWRNYAIDLLEISLGTFIYQAQNATLTNFVLHSLNYGCEDALKQTIKGSTHFADLSSRLTNLSDTTKQSVGKVFINGLARQLTASKTSNDHGGLLEPPLKKGKK